MTYVTEQKTGKLGSTSSTAVSPGSCTAARPSCRWCRWCRQSWGWSDSLVARVLEHSVLPFFLLSSVIVVISCINLIATPSSLPASPITHPNILRQRDEHRLILCNIPSLGILMSIQLKKYHSLDKLGSELVFIFIFLTFNWNFNIFNSFWQPQDTCWVLLGLYMEFLFDSENLLCLTKKWKWLLNF